MSATQVRIRAGNSDRNVSRRHDRQQRSPIEATGRTVTTTKRRIEIQVDKSRLLILRRSGGIVSNWCDDCSQASAMLTADEAAALTNVSSRIIYQRVERGEVHYRETPEGSLLICANSVRGNGES